MSPSQTPSYSFENFKNACNDKNRVFIFGGAIEDAYHCFQLKTKPEILEFISNDGLEHRSFLNTKPWENNPHPEKPIMVDAYEFRSRAILGYIAFFYNELTDKWSIKSFKLSQNANTLVEAFIRAKFVQDKERDKKNE